MADILTAFKSNEYSGSGKLPHKFVDNGDGTYSEQVALGSSTTITATPALGAAAGVSLVSSTAYETGHVLKASAGTLVSLVGYNSGPAQFIQVHNSATVPADAAVPSYVFAIPATSNFSLDFSPTGAPFTTGISVCNSTTGPTKTIGAANCFFSAVVK